MADVTFRRGSEANLPTQGMAEDGCVYQSIDTGNIYIGGGEGNLIPVNRSPYYGVCSTLSSDSTKIVTLDVENDNFFLTDGTLIAVKFLSKNTALSPTLNVNGTGAVSVKRYGTTGMGNKPSISWNDGEVVAFVYDGEYWRHIGFNTMLSFSDIAESPIINNKLLESKNPDSIDSAEFELPIVTYDETCILPISNPITGYIDNRNHSWVLTSGSHYEILLSEDIVGIKVEGRTHSQFCFLNENQLSSVTEYEVLPSIIDTSELLEIKKNVPVFSNSKTYLYVKATDANGNDVIPRKITYMRLRDKDKMDKVYESEDGNVAIFDGSGGVYDSGVWIEDLVNAQPDLVAPVIYSDLVTLKTGGNLVPGMKYRITDYTCTTTQANTQSAGHLFDIIVTADSETELNENARAAQHRSIYVTISEGTTSFTTPSGFDAVDLNSAMRSFPAQSGDRIMCMTGTTTFCIWDEVDGEWAGSLEEFEPSKTYNFITTSQDVRQLSLYLDTYFANCDLDSWEIKYCLENDTNRFVWADDTVNGKGVIYYMKDDMENECPYDFKNIQFKRWEITSCQNCTSLVVNNSDNPHGIYYGAKDRGGNNVVSDATYGSNSGWFYTFSLKDDATGNIYDYSVESHRNLVGEDNYASVCLGNKISANEDSIEYQDSRHNSKTLNNIVFIDAVSNIQDSTHTDIDSCISNTFGVNCSDSTFGPSCQQCNFLGRYVSNTAGSGFDGNRFEVYSQGNKFGNEFQVNNVGGGFIGNTFGNGCLGNTFGNYYMNNLHGNGFETNDIGNYCYQNTFGNNCYTNTLGNDFIGNSFGNHCKYITAFENVKYCNVTGGTSSAPVKNAQILNGTQGTSSHNITIFFRENKNYTQVAGLVNGTDLRIWVAEDTVTGPQTAVAGHIAVFTGTGSQSGKQIMDSGVSVSDLSPDLVTPINYSDLVALKTGGNLVPGTQYRIIDYTCTTTQTNTQSAGHPFDIIVTADSETELNENARAAHRSGDLYFANCDLDAWELKYCLENDTDRFIWADSTSTNGKGVIYYMKDEWNNIAPFDFKNILFTRNTSWFNNHQQWAEDVLGSVPSTDMNFYFLSWVTQNNAVQDLSIVGQTLASDESAYIGVYNNEIKGTTAYSMSIAEDATSTAFALPCTIIVSSYDFDGGNFYGCYSNSFEDGCIGNTLGNNCQSNTFGSNCYGNTFGNYCQNNTFGNDCHTNTFGNDCHSNTFGSSCSRNTFGIDYYNNTFGSSCDNNSFGNNCHGILFGSSCDNNSFGNSCHGILFGSSCNDNTLGNHCQSITIFDSVQYCNVTGGTSSSSPVKNAQILNGTKGTSSSNKLTITFTANQNYTQVAGLVNGTTLRIWIAEDTVTGPQTAVVDNHIAVFNGTTGKIIEDGGFTIEDLQVDVPEYTIAKLDTAETGYISSYVLKKDNIQVGATINIPKDYLVKSGSVVDVVLYEGHYYESTDVEHENELDDYGVNSEGKYLKFIINTADTSQGTGNETLVYISVSDLVDDYVAGDGIRIVNQVGSDAKSIAIKLSLASNGLELVRGEGFDSGLKLNLASYVPGTVTLYRSGAMSGQDKFKLDNIESGAEANVQSDWDQTNNSADDYIKNKPENLSDFTDNLGSNPVHTHSQYALSTDIPTKTSDLENDGSDGTSTYVESDELAAVATTGSYNDLTDKLTEGNGIDISSSNAISVEIDSSNANGLSVGVNGVALSTATTSSAGAMSATDKDKLDNLTDEVYHAGDNISIEESIPYGYTPLEYVYNSSSTYQNTGIRPTVDDVELEFDYRDSTSSDYQCLLGNMPTSSETSHYGLGYFGSANIRLYTKGTKISSGVNSVSGHRFYIKGVLKNGDGSIYAKDITNGTEGQGSGTYTFSETSYNIEIFRRRHNTTYMPSGARVYKAVIKIKGATVLNYIPAKRNSDDVCGFWDTVSKTFVTATAGQWNAGPVSSWEKHFTISAINIPTATSELTNDSGFITNADIPVTDVTVGGTSVVDSNGVAVVPAIPDSTSDLVNDSGFITAADVPSPADAAPLMDGTAAVGTSTDYAREDHIHPKDTSKADKVSNAASGNFAGLDSNGNLTDSSHNADELVPSGGTTGQVLAKHSNRDNDVEWVTPEETEMSVSINYSDLVVLKTGGNLVPGTKYRITDYTCTTTQANTQSAGHPFDIIVTADSETELNENARAAHHSGDTYFANCDLDSWEIKYCLENDTNRFVWADDTVNGKGVIYYMKDEWGNIAPFDFKNMLFTRSATWFSEHQSWATSVLGSVPSTDMNFYFLSWVTQNNSVQDLSIVGQTLANNEDTYSGVYNNEIKETTSKDIGITEDVTSNTFALPCTIIVNAYNYQTGVFYGCYSNTFGNGCYNNTFGNRFNNVTFGDRCYSNTFGNNCYNNTLGNSCYSNLLGNGCVNNSFGSNCSQNTFGDYCFQNSFGIGCYENSFGNYFINNNLGNYCYSNTFGNYCQYLTVFGNVVYCNVTGGTSSDPVKNAQILNGTQGTSSSNKRTISFAADANYTQVAGLVNGTTLRIWIAENTVTGPQTAGNNNIPVFSGTGSNLGKQIIDSGHKVNELLPSGGTTGQVLAKESNTNFDVEWVTLEETEMSVSITYSDLVTLKNGGNLVPGTKYRITDYNTTVSEDLTDVSVAEHQFDIIVTALSETELDHRASAVQHEGDTYFSDCDLSKWQLWYDIENDTEKYEWAVGDSSSSNGGAKGVPEYAPEYILSDDISGLLNNAGLSIALVFQGIETITLKEDVECYVYGTSVQAGALEYEKIFLQDYPSIGTSIYGIGSKGDIHTISTVTGISSSTQPTNGTKIIAKSVTSGETANLLNQSGISPELEFNGQIVMYKGQNCYSYGSSAQYTVLAKEYKNISGIIVADGVSPIVPKKVSEPGTNVIILDGENEIPDPITTISQETVVVGGSGGGTGVIYRMIDEWGNDCPYDFKNIMFTDNSTNYYTFDILVDSVHNDFSVTQTSKNCYGNTIKSFIYKFGSSYKYSLSRNIFKNRESSSVCCSNTFENRCHGNNFGNNCYGNTFGYDCVSNTFDGSCSNNTFGNGCSSSSFGNDCYGNTFGYGCSSNTFGDDCSNNSFGNSCSNNTFGNSYRNNTFGNDCSNNSFGNGCYSNSFGNSFRNNSFGNYCQYLTVFENVRYCNVTGGTSLAPVKNAQILNSTQGTSSSSLTIAFTANQNYTQVAGLVNGTDLRIWVDEDTVTGPQTAVVDNHIAVFDGTTGKIIEDGGLTVAELQAGIPSPADAAPLMDGTAAVGTSTDYAREDHIHPKDTSKADKVSNAIEGNFAGLDSNGNLTDSGHDSSELVPSGGTTGQVLAKHSGTDNDVEWVTHYWANQSVQSSVSYITTPEVKQITINGSTTDAASTDHCVMVYDTVNKCLKFTF